MDGAQSFARLSLNLELGKDTSMKTAIIATFASLLAGNAAYAAAFDDVAPSRPVEHRVWVMECFSEDGQEYYVGWDARDKTIQIKTPHGRPYTYAGVASQLTPYVFEVAASRSDQHRMLLLHFDANSSWLRSIGRNSDGSDGGQDDCVVKGGRD